MKKILILLLVAMFALPAHATFIKDVQVIGEVQTIASDVKNASVPLYYRYTYTRGAKMRVMAGLSFDIVERATAKVLFQYSHMWGEDSAAGRTVQNYWDNSYLAEANVVIHDLFDNFELTVGRQFYGDEDSPVIYFGPKHYNAELSGYDRTAFPGYGRKMWLAPSVDAAKLVYTNDWMAATLIAGRMGHMDDYFWSLREPNYLNKNIALYGADVKLKLTEDFGIQLYGYDFEGLSYYTKNPGSYREDEPHTGIYGGKLKYAPEHFLASVEYARNLGGDTLFKEYQNTGHMLKADAAVKPVDAFALRGTFYYASFYYINFGNYSPGLLIGDLLQDRLSRYGDGNVSSEDSGIRLFNVGMDFKPTHKWTVSLDGYSFQSAHADHQAALEADLTVKYVHNEYIELFAGVGYVRYSKKQGSSSQSPFFELAEENRENYKSQIGMLVHF